MFRKFPREIGRIFFYGPSLLWKGRVLSGVEIASFRGKQICRRQRRRRWQHRRSYVLWCKSCLRSAVCMYFENREVKNGLKSFLRSTQPSKNTWRQQSFSEYEYNFFDSQIHLNEVIVIGGFVYTKYRLGVQFCYFNFVACDIFKITDHAQDDISPSKTITAHLWGKVPVRNFSIRRVNAKAACNGTIVTPIATGYTPSPPFHNLLLSMLKVSFFSLAFFFVDIVGSKLTYFEL